MKALSNRIVDRLPTVVPRDIVREENEDHEFTVLNYEDGTSSTKYVYILDKAPISRVERVEGIVDGFEFTFVEGTDYTVIDDDGDGELDSIDFSIGGTDPDDNSVFHVTYVAESVISRYTDAHDDDLATVIVDLEQVIESHQIDSATGRNLDRIGSLFGELGRRRDRGDEEYRALLKSIVQSFKGRGTIPGMKFAIAVGIGTDPDNIEIREDFEQAGYEIVIDESVETDFVSSVVNDMAELADPSGVDLLSAPIIVLEGEDVIVDETGTRVVEEKLGLGANVLTLDGESVLGSIDIEVVTPVRATPITASGTGPRTATVSTTDALADPVGAVSGDTVIAQTFRQVGEASVGDTIIDIPKAEASPRTATRL